jgi:hypothetical protein
MPPKYNKKNKNKKVEEDDDMAFLDSQIQQNVVIEEQIK